MVKYIFIFLVIIINKFSYSQKEQDIKEKYKDLPVATSILKTDPLSMLWGTIPLTSEYKVVYETLVSKKQTLQFSVSYLGKCVLLALDTVTTGLEDLVVSGFRFQAAYKIYLKKAPEGWYVAPMFSFSQAKFTDTYYKSFAVYIQGKDLNINAIIGYQKINNKGCLDVYTGIGYRQISVYEYYPPKINKLPNTDLFIFDIPIKFYLGVNFGFSL